MLLQGYAGDQHRLHCKSHRFDRFGAGEVWTFSEDQSSSVEPPNELVVESCPMSSMQSWIFLTCVLSTLSSLKTFKLLIFFLRCDLDVVSEIHRNTVRRLHSC